MVRTLYLFAYVSLLLSGAIFGFFYAWVCSTMWGLDKAHPAVAIEAMQAMNSSVRNAVFAPAFFGTPAFLLVTSVLSHFFGFKRSTLLFASAAIIYLCGGLILTFAINVPMNEALALVSAPLNVEEAARIWQDYSSQWQFWNTVRTVFSGITLALTGFGIQALTRMRVQND
ncbi:DUF1772 domain-containing protein [Rhizobium sp. CFBP 8762]|uniref:anthrone oxygenase family protein n=1 Tax=Rhizobium sp. CFBP 8762 TaxID=2775279 RepID=UPI00177A8D0C|nr:anthrone oxygenase family protein [Rhizobium sp. CFBP 8762]MBD8556190.1 DUF1772 domain-containing protein [Rhizobium sp. CFBP 8762]